MRYKLEIDIRVNENNEVEVDNTRITPIICDEVISVITTLTESSFKYNLITFNSKSNMAESFKLGDKVKIKYLDIIINNVKVGSIKGRFTGLSKIISDIRFLSKFDVGDKIKLVYNKSSGIIEISGID